MRQEATAKSRKATMTTVSQSNDTDNIHKAELTHKAFSLYKQTKYREALDAFDALAKFDQDSKTYSFFRERCIDKLKTISKRHHAKPQIEATNESTLQDIEAIKSQGLFDPGYYRQTYPDLKNLSDDECIIHFCTHGYKEDRRPIKGFMPSYYKRHCNPKDSAADNNPLAIFARKEKRDRDSVQTGALLYPDWICSNTSSIHFSGSISLDINSEAELAKKRIAVFCHIHYNEVVEDIIDCIRPLSQCASFHFTFSSEETLRLTQSEFSSQIQSGEGSSSFELCENIGRDLIPFVQSIERHGKNYDLILKIHGKRSADSEIISGSDWRAYLTNNLIGSCSNVLAITRLFDSDPKLGIVYPPHYENVFQYCTWGASLTSKPAAELEESLALDKDDNKIISFPSGSMFWARPEALSCWVSLIKSYDIEQEPLPRDGTTLHFFERALPYALIAAGHHNCLHLNRCLSPAIDITTSALVRLVDIVKWKIKSTKILSNKITNGQQHLSINIHDKPDCSIIIPVYKNYIMTLQCLCSIYLAKDDTSIEVIIVDDCSPEHLNIPLSKFGVKVIRNESNLGFVGSCNAGAAQAKGQKIVFLNNDTIVLNNWLSPLSKHLDNPEVGIAGSMLLYPDGSLQEAGGCIWQDGNGLNYGRNDNPNDPKYNFTRDADYCSGASLAIKSSLFNSLGGFDTIFSPGYYEDTDLCFKVRANGLKVLYEPKSKVIHLEGKSSENVAQGGMKRHQEVNKIKFLERWSDTLKSYTKPHEDRFYANRNKTSKLLILDSYIPTPDKDSGSNDLVLAIQLLSKFGYEVTFVPTWEIGYNPHYLGMLEEIGTRVYPQEYQYHCSEWIKSLKDEFDICLILRYDNYHRFSQIVREANRAIKIVYDTVDLHFVREEREAKTIAGKVDNHHIDSIRKAEIDAIHDADHSFVRSAYELKLLCNDHSLSAKKISILPICRPIKIPAKSFKERSNIVFIGGFKHSPNVDCIQYFLDHIFPLILSYEPSITLTIAGSHVEILMDKVVEINHPNIVIQGYVEDLTTLFESHRLSIAPLRFGAGTKGKVISSLCHGIPCVVTSVACEGMIGIENDVHLSIRNKPIEFAKRCVELHNDESKWDMIAANALMYAQEYASISTMERALLDSFKRLTNEPCDSQKQIA
jgi:GT2 family glycosyltransferase